MKKLFHRLGNLLFQRVDYLNNQHCTLKKEKDHLYYRTTDNHHMLDKPLNARTLKMLNAVTEVNLKDFLALMALDKKETCEKYKIDYTANCSWGGSLIPYIFDINRRHEGKKQPDLMKMLDIILSQCPDLLEIKNKNGFTPFYQAIQYERKDMFEKLINLGANIEAHPQMSAINLAAFLNYKNHNVFEFFLKKLLSHQAKINDFDHEGFCPLAQSLMFDRRDSQGLYTKKAQILLDHGADPQIKNAEGKSILELLSETKNMIPVANYIWICNQITDREVIEKSLKIIHQNTVFTSRAEDLIELDRALTKQSVELEKMKINAHLGDGNQSIANLDNLVSIPESSKAPRRKNQHKI